MNCGQSTERVEPSPLPRYTVSSLCPDINNCIECGELPRHLPFGFLGRVAAETLEIYQAHWRTGVWVPPGGLSPGRSNAVLEGFVFFKLISCSLTLDFQYKVCSTLQLILAKNLPFRQKCTKCGLSIDYFSSGCSYLVYLVLQWFILSTKCTVFHVDWE